jgi:protein-disulfide isomerase
MSKKKIAVALTVIVASVAFIAGAFIYAGEKASPVVDVDTARASLIREHSPVIGPQNAPVTIIEFFDPSCEACRAYYPYVKQILERYPTQVRLVLRYVAFHKGSPEAIGILEAARAQGKLEPALFNIFRDQPVWANHNHPNLDAAWKSVEEAGVNVAKGKRDAAREQVNAIIAQDMSDVSLLDVRGTPTFYIGGQRLNISGPDDLAKQVDAAVVQAIDP